MELIRVGSKVTLTGINGFAMVNEVIYCHTYKKTLANCEVYLHENLLCPPPIVLVDIEDCKPFELAKGRAVRVYASSDDSLHAAMVMAGEG